MSCPFFHAQLAGVFRVLVGAMVVVIGIAICGGDYRCTQSLK